MPYTDYFLWRRFPNNHYFETFLHQIHNTLNKKPASNDKRLIGKHKRTTITNKVVKMFSKCQRHRTNCNRCEFLAFFARQLELADRRTDLIQVNVEIKIIFN